MPASAVRPELGPTLPALLRPLPRAAKLGVAAVVVLLLAVLVATRLGGSSGVERAVVTAPIGFNVAVPDGLTREDPPAGAALAITGRDAQSLVVAPLTLPAYRGDVSAALLAVSGPQIDRLRASLDGFVLRQEGRTRINEAPGYQLLYQFRRDGRTAYGRLVALAPPEEEAPRPREGVLVDLRTDRSAAVPNVFATGNNGALKTALRSFRFGTDAP